MGIGCRALVLPKKGKYSSIVDMFTVGVFMLGMAWAFYLSSTFVVVNADTFTDIFRTSNFRGSFAWFSKMGWIGTLVQAVISVFSLVGVSLIVIRIMTSFLYLSAKGLWEEVHELKQGGSDDGVAFGIGGMIKTVWSGKSGTGLDAIMGAILVLLPDVKRYSDFGEKSGVKFDSDDLTLAQYALKIALPTVLSVFFFAMAFNGTLLQGLAVTVEAMGTVADQAVSINYAGFAEDLVNANTGYKFLFDTDGTQQGKLKQSLAKELYSQVLIKVKGETPEQMGLIGKRIESMVNDEMGDWIEESKSLSQAVQTGLSQVGAASEPYYERIRAQVETNASASVNGVDGINLETIMDGIGGSPITGSDIYFHIFFSEKNAGNANEWSMLTDD